MEYIDKIIDAMTDVVVGEDAGERERRIYRESLQALVRLARAEQLLEIQLDFNALTGVGGAKRALPYSIGVGDADIC